MKKNIAIASHVAYIDGKEYDGLGNVMIETLGATVPDFTVIRHSMDGLLPSEVRQYKKKKIVQTRRLHVIPRPAPIRYVTEFITVLWHFSFKQKVSIFIGIDPLNAIAAVFLKKIGRVDQAIFFTPDYSPKRFNNQVLNSIYHSIDRYCVRNADEVWSVSSKIAKIRRNMGLSEAKNILVPNVPPTEYNYLRKNSHDKYNLITSGIISTQLDFSGAIEAVALLKDRMPKIKLTIIGNGPDEKRLKSLSKKLKVEDRVFFTGRVSLEEVLQHISKAGIGLALYTGEWGFNEFGDSTKCREYFTFGLPVVSTDTHATVDEIRSSGAGIIVDKNVKAYVKAIEEIFKDYNSYSKASQELGKAFEGIHKKQIIRLLEK